MEGDELERIKRRLRILKNDIYIAMIIDDYPVVRDFLENTRPFSVATMGGYIKLMRNATNVNGEVKKRIIELENVYLGLLNEKLARIGGCWVELDDDGYTVLKYFKDGELGTARLSFNEIMNIYGGKNIEEIVEKIIERNEGETL